MLLGGDLVTGNERLIVVVGMAHSGTTILAHVLRQHPEVQAAVNGREAWIMENDWLPREQTEPIQKALHRPSQRRILLKRPWNCVWHADWMAAEMPNARFLYCYRDFDEISRSWSKPTSLVEERLRNGGVEHQREFYQFCRDRAEAVGRSVSFFKRVYHAEFLRNPVATMSSIADWAGLAPFSFDVSQVGADQDIKNWLWRRVTRSAELGVRSAERKNSVELGMRSEESMTNINAELGTGNSELVTSAEASSGIGPLANPKPVGMRSQPPGRYTYRRLGYDQRPMELKCDGIVGDGAAGNERNWCVRMADGVALLEIHGEARLIATCRCDSDCVWRGRWTRFERMPIELIPEGM